MPTWSCPHQMDDYFCQRVKKTCEPGMKGCVLRGKVRFAEEDEIARKIEAELKNSRKGSEAS